MSKRHHSSKPRPDQLMSFILTPYSHRHHGTLEGAQAERERLEKTTLKKFKLVKVLNISSEDLERFDVQITLVPKQEGQAA